MPISNGLAALGGLGQGVQQGIQNIFQFRRLAQEDAEKKAALDQQKAQLGLLAAKEGYDFDPTSGLLSQSDYGRQKRESELADLALKPEEHKAKMGLMDAQAGYYRTGKGALQDEKRRKETDHNVQTLSKRLTDGGLAELGTVGKDILSKINLDSEDDIPGAGMTGFLPDFLVSQEGKDVRQSVGALRNIILKARSGGAVTPQEAARFEEELGIGAKRTDAQLRTGLKSVLGQLNAKKKGLLAGFDDSTRNEFSNRGGDTGLLDLSSAPAKDPLEGRTATGSGGEKIIRRGGQWVPLK
jgi:hypothetical protein